MYFERFYSSYFLTLALYYCFPAFNILCLNMDLPLNQPSWEQGQIQGASSIYSSGPGLPYVSHLGVKTASGVTSCFGAPCSNPAISDTHSWNHLQLGHASYYTAPMLAATSRLGALYGGPNLIGQLDPSLGVNGTTGDLQIAVPSTQLPAPPAPASSPSEPKSRSRKKNLGRDKKYAIILSTFILPHIGLHKCTSFSP